MLRHTVGAFARHAQIDGVVIVTGADDVERCREVLAGLDKVMAVVAGRRVAAGKSSASDCSRWEPTRTTLFSCMTARARLVTQI